MGALRPRPARNPPPQEANVTDNAPTPDDTTRLVATGKAGDLASYWKIATSRPGPVSLRIHAIGQVTLTASDTRPLLSVEDIRVVNTDGMKWVDITVWASTERGHGGMIGFQVAYDFPITWSVPPVHAPIRNCDFCGKPLRFSVAANAWLALDYTDLLCESAPDSIHRYNSEV